MIHHRMCKSMYRLWKSAWMPSESHGPLTVSTRMGGMVGLQEPGATYYHMIGGAHHGC